MRTRREARYHASQPRRDLDAYCIELKHRLEVLGFEDMIKHKRTVSRNSKVCPSPYRYCDAGVVLSDPDCGLELLAYSGRLILIRGLAAAGIQGLLRLGFICEVSTACKHTGVTRP